MDIKFEGGGHVGDCSVYISYDVNVPTNAAQFVKIANLPDCRKQINTLVPIMLPTYLPAGNAILRWDQYALHQGSFIEWYVQCADIAITSSSARSWDSFNKFSIARAYPGGMSNYRRNIAVPGDADFYMTGPACVDDSLNQCALTARDTKGYSGVGGGDGQAPSPVPLPSPNPAPVPNPSPAPPPAVTCVPIGDCDAYSWCTQAAYIEYCGEQSCPGCTCPLPFCMTTGPVPLPMPVPTPALVPAPPSGRRCVPGGGSFSDPAIWGPVCESQGQADVCTAPICKWETALVQVKARKHNFLGTALIQAETSLEREVSIRDGFEL